MSDMHVNKKPDDDDELVYLAGIFIWPYWQLKQKAPKYETVKYSFEFSYTIHN